MSKVSFSAKTVFTVLSLMFFLTLGLLLSAAAEDPWADAVVEHNAINPLSGFTDTNDLLGAPAGGGVFAPNNAKAYCLGLPGAAPGSYVILKFNTPVENDPDNPMGLDFVVHGNAFWVGGDPNRKWAEPALVEISADQNLNGLPDEPWYVIPGSRGLASSVLPSGIPNPSPPLAGSIFNNSGAGMEANWGYADMSPTLQPCRDNYMRPDDPLATGLTPKSGGGDAFDIAWAVNTSGSPAGLGHFDFIRISAFIAGSVSGFGAPAPEISAVADIDPLTDADGDGIADAYEMRVAGTDPNRSESTVLPLEIPSEYGGSPAGTLLGSASDALGNAVTFYSKGARTGARNYNSAVDILPASIPSPPVPDLIKSGACVEFVSDITLFSDAQIQDARFTLAYLPSDIAGLDEGHLVPRRFTGGAWSAAEIYDVERNPAANTVSFSCQEPGLFVLASVAGAGDLNPDIIPVVLDASPAAGVTADGVSLVTVTSRAILDGQGTPLPDGTPLTLSLTPAGICVLSTPDADPATAGHQLAVSGGIIQFSMQSTTRSGRVNCRIASEDGAVAGETSCMFLPGPPAEPAALWPLNPAAKAPGTIPFGTSLIRDANGNTVSDGTELTLVVQGGVPQGADANPAADGFQVRVLGGVLSFAVVMPREEKSGTRPLLVSLHAEPELITLIAEEAFSFEYVPVPAPAGVVPALPLLLAGVAALAKRRRGRGK